MVTRCVIMHCGRTWPTDGMVADSKHANDMADAMQFRRHMRVPTRGDISCSVRHFIPFQTSQTWDYNLVLSHLLWIPSTPDFGRQYSERGTR